MSSTLDRILGLKDLSLASEDVAIEFARGLPLWAWVLIVGGLALYAGWSYWRLQGNRAARSGLAVLRLLILLLLALLIAGPQVVRSVEKIEKDWVVVMVDRSASMQVRDGPDRQTRDAQARAALEAASPALARLQGERQVLMLGFDAGSYELVLPNDSAAITDALGEPGGIRTALGASLEQALRSIAAKPVAGIVLLSDGRSFDSPSREVLQELEERTIGVYPVALGSPQPLADLALARVDAPQAAFVGDLVPVVVDVEALGLAPGEPMPEGVVQLLGDAGEVLDEKPLVRQGLEAGRERLTLTSKAASPGRSAWRVRVVPREADLSDENNSASLAMEMVDRPLRVLYIDGTPRWEYRYLKNLLLREASVRSTTLLLAAEKRFLQEGTDRLATMPVTTQDWAAFDVVLLGDVRPGLFSQEQLASLRELVATRGAGLLWIGGAAFTPTAWPATPLGDMLPFRLQSESAGLGQGFGLSSQAVLLTPGPAADVYGLLRLGDDPARPWPEALGDPALRWPLLRWSQQIDASLLKPSAEVLALGQPIGPDGASAGAPRPLVMTMRYGAGRIAYVATDETWRYRYGRGEALTERFWIPLVRLLARGSLGRSGKPAILEATPQTALTNQPVRVQLTLLDQSLLERRMGDTQVRVRRITETTRDGPGNAESVVTLVAQAPVGTAREASASLASFVGTFVPDQPGEYEITAMDASLAGLDIAARVRVVVPEDELRRPQTDHAALASLATQTGGAMLTRDDLATLDTRLPNRQVRVLGNPQVETLWDKPIVLILAILLLGLEWGGRRLVKLS